MKSFKERVTVFADKELYREVRIKLMRSKTHPSFAAWLEEKLKDYMSEE